MSLLLSLLGGGGAKIAGVVAAALAVGLAYLGIRRSGAQAQRAADARETLREVKDADRARDAVAGLSDAAAADRLRSSWTR